MSPLVLSTKRSFGNHSNVSVVPWTRPEPPAIGLTGFLRRATDLGLGAASIATSAAVDAIERFVPGEPSEPDNGIAQPGVVRLVPGALMGAGQAERGRRTA